MASDLTQTQRKTAGAIFSASNYVAGGAAITGAAFGAGYATLKGRPVVLWTVVAGGQCGVLGWTFWVTRSVLQQNTLHASSSQLSTSQKDLLYSTAAGSFSGLVGGAFRGRGNILPGAIAMSLVGLGGQLGYNILSVAAIREGEKKPLLDRLSDSKWWPLKALPDEEYERELTEKIIAIEAEVSIINEKISHLKQGAQTGKHKS